MRKFITVLTIALTLLFSTVFSSAAENPNVILVNPAANGTVYSSNLLISVKLIQPITIKVSVFEEKQMVNGTLSSVNVSVLSTTNGAVNYANFTPVLAREPATFKSASNLSFYTKQVNDLKPGLYKIQIETLDAANNPVYTNSSHVAIKEKPAEDKIFETPQSGTMQFLQNLLKTIFGN